MNKKKLDFIKNKRSKQSIFYNENFKLKTLMKNKHFILTQNGEFKYGKKIFCFKRTIKILDNISILLIYRQNIKNLNLIIKLLNNIISEGKFILYASSGFIKNMEIQFVSIFKLSIL